MNSTHFGSPLDTLIRLGLATVGGYFGSLWAAILLAPLLPGQKHTQVLAAIELVFLIYLLVFIWAFTRHSLKTFSAEFTGFLVITGTTVWAIHGSLA